MKRFISYLYEYGQGQKIRNIGFAKAELNDSEGLIQIHGKGIQPPRQGMVKVYLCYEKNGQCIGMFQGEIEHTEPAVDYRLFYTSEDTGGQLIYEQIAGIILKTEDERTYAALWGEKMMNPEMLMESENAIDETQIKLPEVPEPDLQAQPNMQEEMSSQEEEKEEQPVKEEAKEEPAVMEEIQEEVAENEKVLHEMDCNEVCQEPQIKYEKITREELAKLPRCEWGNANNTFLLHGYRNYHHLLLVDDQGQLWLGVPGVYHEREQIAASSCGFPRFWRIPEEHLQLPKDERNEKEDFGYWCRKVRRRK